MRAFLLFVIISCCAAQQRDDGQDPVIQPIHTSVTITAAPVEPAFDSQELRGLQPDAVLARRSDVPGSRRGQHEGDGKSLEIRRFGFNLDHGGVNGGLKVLVEDIPQNQTTQGQGQGYRSSR